LEDFIKEIYQAQYLRKVYPNLCDSQYGIRFGEIHRYFVTYLGLLGAHLGYIPIIEPVILNIATKRYTGEKVQESKRPDAVWRNSTYQTGFKNFAFFEYEGVSSANGLIKKTKNLIKMYDDAESKPDYLVLIYWKKSGQIVKSDITRCIDIFNKGFVINKTKIKKPDAKFFIIESKIKKNKTLMYHFNGFILIHKNQL